MFCDIELAGRIERAEAQFIAGCGEAAARRRGDRAGFVVPVAGGVAGFAGPDSPLNKVAGLGFGGLPEPAELDAIERRYADRGAPVQAEVASLADPRLLELLAGRGYRLVSFENVLGRALGGAVERVDPPGVDVRRSGDDEFDTWLDVVVDGSLHPDTQGVPWHEEFPRDVYLDAMRDSVATGTRRYIALRDGVIAGGIAQLTGAATAPSSRRRGIQSALLSARLAAAAEAGCEVAVITVQPGSRSQQNAQRRGFELLYTRAILA
jgi:GNAT superfamily N-acetyltransferase